MQAAMKIFMEIQANLEEHEVIDHTECLLLLFSAMKLEKK